MACMMAAKPQALRGNGRFGMLMLVVLLTMFLVFARQAGRPSAESGKMPDLL
jgi:hypothetical protein